MLSPAKINIGLEVPFKREDGFHEIYSIFTKINWGDEIEFERTSSSGEFLLESRNELIKEKKQSFEEVSERGDLTKNILYKAYERALSFSPDIPGLRVKLIKRIPTGGGLGGGSSNAAMLLKVLFKGTDWEFSESLNGLAAGIGSDVPFFLREEPAFVYGRGEKFYSIKLASGQGVLGIPPVEINTKEAYNYLKKPLQKTTITEPWNFLTGELSQALRLGDWHVLQRFLVNDFEEFAFKQFPLLKSLKEDFYSLGCSFASMTGSGSCFFGLLRREEESAKVQNGLIAKYPGYDFIPFSF
ncbi:MAG: 4-(cytidine 5'-diphospho)-2-C-methyl-D-erythritol kinase [Leptospiraceae bacterium]|nr:4-(cytidine 5'-diphospho)-2-C-methyl-D-erythritol kinase [Leptospiraceae bacterium]MCP5502217.1 4-(cytidine 5'-diphospho)-2-C-methyl-D-erythritol kinase [Leptospiraceae bacterium]